MKSLTSPASIFALVLMMALTALFTKMGIYEKIGEGTIWAISQSLGAMIVTLLPASWISLVTIWLDKKVVNAETIKPGVTTDTPTATEEKHATKVAASTSLITKILP